MADEKQGTFRVDPAPGVANWRLSANLGEWALPLFVRRQSDPVVTYAAVHFLCFSLSYERWAE